MLDLNEVRMFVHVVRARSFSEAARRMTVPANTLSRRIRKLEASLGTRLMQRSTRKLTLTAAGQAFFDRCATAVDGVLEAGKVLVEGSRTPSGSVRVAAPADFLDLFQMDWIAEFLELHPEVHLDFVLDDARADLIEEGIDVAFRGGGTRDGQAPYRQITRQSFKLVTSPAYAQRRGTPQTLQQLEEHDCLTGSSLSRPVTWTLLGPDGVEQVGVSGRFSANSARSLLKSCVAGLGIALLPTMLIAPDLRAGRLLSVLPDYRRDGADFNVLLPSREQIPAAVAVFVEFAMARLHSMVSASAV